MAVNQRGVELVLHHFAAGGEDERRRRWNRVFAVLDEYGFHRHQVALDRGDGPGRARADDVIFIRIVDACVSAIAEELEDF